MLNGDRLQCALTDIAGRKSLFCAIPGTFIVASPLCNESHLFILVCQKRKFETAEKKKHCMLAPLDASTTTCAAVGMKKLQQYHTDFQNDHAKKYCPQAVPVPERL